MEKKNNLSEYNSASIPSAKEMRIGIVVAEWNPEITDALLHGATETLLQHGMKAENMTVTHVPGSYELTAGAAFQLRHLHLDAVICLGCVIQGETRHFEFICQAVSQGLTHLALQENRPVIFGLLTTNDMQQARERSGGKHGNKGVECAVTAIKMVQAQRDILEQGNKQKRS
ncbi:MAG: 6,7-dimethyl-8-ribityllumazine synthase [Bacteroidales bacterium]|nr:6,7-dimethyl-8-ribityllumazine synthase [Bacteroidales bacterium]